MDFISNKQPQIDEMLQRIGVGSIDELFSSIPDKLKISRPKTDDGLSEFEALKLMQSLADSNTYPKFENYLGAGSYEHHVPAIVSAVCSKSEFLTSYTPYQPEISQGMLQIIFEFQSAICALTGLDVSNASLYDGASACAEAMLMAMRLQKEKNKVLVAGTLHPNYKDVVELYLKSHGIEIITIPYTSQGRLDEKQLLEKLDVQTAAVLIQSPNFLGIVEDLQPIAKAIHEAEALFILCSNPLSYGLYASAADVGADIAVGDCQPFGLPMMYGGPYVGYIACRQEFVRQMPGRIVGETLDTEGRRGFVLTLQAREQHIRREKATSNICTNQALAALASLTAMLWYGKKGVYELALTNFQRASYLKHTLQAIPGIKTMDSPIFNEFAVKFQRSAAEVLDKFRNAGIEPGLHLGTHFPDLKDYFLVAVTETKSKEQLDKYVSVSKGL